jgi:hypothetical protein
MNPNGGTGRTLVPFVVFNNIYKEESRWISCEYRGSMQYSMDTLDTRAKRELEESREFSGD